MGIKERRTDEILRYEARTNFKGIEGVDASVKYFRENPEELFDRVNEFDQVCIKLTNLMRRSTFDPDVYQNVAVLNGLLHGQSLPTLTGMITMGRSNKVDTDKKVNLQEAIKSTLGEVREKSITKDWKFPTELPHDPGKVAAGMLIEGYGLFAEKYYGKEGLAKTFVLAFEEVLITSYRRYNAGVRHPEEQSKLLADVIDWMVEEVAEDKNIFSPLIINRINQEKSDRKIYNISEYIQIAKANL